MAEQQNAPSARQLHSHPSTEAVRAGERSPKPGHAMATPIFQTATYTFEDTQSLRAYADGQVARDKYGRYGNPTQRTVEQKLALLEHGDDALLFPSGMAAVTTTLWAHLSSGDHAAFGSECYKQIRQFAYDILPRFGVEVSFFDTGDLDGLELKPNTKLVFVESPGNPFLSVADLEELSILTRAHRTPLIVDSTFATPVNQQPLAWGADLVVQSATKYLGGHNDLLAGAVIGRPQAMKPIRALQSVTGCVIDPHNAYLLLRGLKTLTVRVEKQNESALQIARFLESHPSIERVYYPGLPSHPSHEVAQRQMIGYGGVISFEVKADDAETAHFVDALTIPSIASSFGGVDSLVEQTWLISYASLSQHERDALGIRKNLVRLSLGIEDPADLMRDLEQALATLPPEVS